MYYSGIIKDDVANGIGIRTTLFVSGCRNNCPGCFNKAEQDFQFGVPYTEAVTKEILDSISPYHKGITIMGGDPMEPENARDLCLDLVAKFRQKFGNKKDIWVYTGYKFEYLLSCGDPYILQLLSMTDILVDGPFIESEKDVTLMFKGSRNQRTIYVPKSLKEQCVITIDNLDKIPKKV